MNTRSIVRMVIVGLLNISTLMVGIVSAGNANVEVVNRAERPTHTAGNRALSLPRVLIAGAWQIENNAEEAGPNRWRITSRGTNTSGTRLYDCTAKLSLDGSGTIFPEVHQKVGDFEPGESFVVTWTVEVGRDSKGYEVRWCGWPERDPSKREPGGCN